MINEDFFQHRYYIDSSDDCYICTTPSRLGQLIAIKYRPMKYNEDHGWWDASIFLLGEMKLVDGKKRFIEIHDINSSTLVETNILIQEKSIRFFHTDFPIEEELDQYHGGNYEIQLKEGMPTIEFKDLFGRHSLWVELSLWPLLQHKMVQIAEIGTKNLFPDEERI